MTLLQTLKYGAAEGRGLQGDQQLCLFDNSDLTLFSIQCVQYLYIDIDIDVLKVQVTHLLTYSLKMSL